jgi:hypothetical protein
LAKVQSTPASRDMLASTDKAPSDKGT